MQCLGNTVVVSKFPAELWVGPDVAKTVVLCGLVKQKRRMQPFSHAQKLISRKFGALIIARAWD